MKTEYQVIEAGTPALLEDKLNAEAVKGWEPIGNLVVTVSTLGITHHSGYSSGYIGDKCNNLTLYTQILRKFFPK